MREPFATCCNELAKQIGATAIVRATALPLQRVATGRPSGSAILSLRVRSIESCTISTTRRRACFAVSDMQRRSHRASGRGHVLLRLHSRRSEVGDRQQRRIEGAAGRLPLPTWVAPPCRLHRVRFNAVPTDQCCGEGVPLAGR